MQYQFRLDYATFNFDEGAMSPELVGKTLLGDEDLSWRRCGVSDNAPLQSPLGLFWRQKTGSIERPHCLQVSGVGCEHFSLTLPALRAAAPCHFSRLDFAFDVIMDRSEWRHYIVQVFQSSLNSERKRKRYKLQGDGEAMTIYIGSRASAKFFRIYNKTLEDKQYEYYDADGNRIDLTEDQCVIRYEVELHRYKRISTVEGETLYDPSCLFDKYYSDDPSEREDLGCYIRSLWLNFGNEILLPPGFEEVELIPRTCQNGYFVHSLPSARLELVRDKLHDFPHSFDRTLNYVAERFGRYIPYILSSPELTKMCFDRCRLDFGFEPKYYFECTFPAGYNDLDETSDDLPQQWFEADERDQLIIDNTFEGGFNQWSFR